MTSTSSGFNGGGDAEARSDSIWSGSRVWEKRKNRRRSKQGSYMRSFTCRWGRIGTESERILRDSFGGDELVFIVDPGWGRG